MVTPRRIKIINSLIEGILNHLRCRRLVDFLVPAVNHRKAHCAHTKRRQFQILKLLINHSHYPPLIADQSACLHRLVITGNLILQSFHRSLDGL